MSKGNVLALHGGYFTENFGDELLLAIHAKWVKEILDAEVVLPFGEVIYDQEVDAKAIKGLQGLRIARKLIYSGGGYFGEPNHKSLKWGFAFFKRLHFLPAEYFKLSRKPYAIIGVGAGPLSNWFTRKAVLRICKHAKLIAVRDEESKSFLSEYGINPEKIHVTADMVLSLTTDDLNEEAIKEASKLLQAAQGKKIVGVHLAVSKNDPFYGQKSDYISKGIVEFFNKHKDFIPVLIADKRNCAEQNSILEELKNSLINKYIVYKHQNIWLTCAILSQLDSVFTTKLHVGITAYSLGTKMLSIAAHQKTLRFYSQIQQPENCIPLSDLNSTEMFTQLFTQFVNSDVNIEKYKDIRESIRQKSLMNKILTKDFLLNH